MKVAGVPKESVRLRGVAQTPKSLPWKPNEGNRERCPDREVPSMCDDHKIQFPEDVQFFKYDSLPADVYAAYLLDSLSHEGDMWGWNRLLNRYDMIPIRTKSVVLASDEAIVAVMTHESFELTGLRKRMPDGHTITAKELYHLISPDIPGNLHCQAWDAADGKLQSIRSGAGQ